MFSIRKKMYKPASFYEYACVLLEVPENVQKAVCILANDIDPDIVNVDEGGIEDNPHITVLYGVGDDLDLSKYFTKPILMKTDTKITYFDNDKTSVAKVDIICPELKDIHLLMKSKESNQHEYEYHPHMTIAFLNKGKRLENDGFVHFSWIQKHISLRKNGLLDKYVL